jgi:uncharacterized membrane protein
MPVSAISATSLKPIDAPKTLTRVTSLDIVRGVAMILMAIDHVRVYSGVPAGGPTVGVFFTRWITNFVAPAFVFSPAYLPISIAGGIPTAGRSRNSWQSGVSGSSFWN